MFSLNPSDMPSQLCFIAPHEFVRHVIEDFIWSITELSMSILPIQSFFDLVLILRPNPLPALRYSPLAGGELQPVDLKA